MILEQDIDQLRSEIVGLRERMLGGDMGENDIWVLVDKAEGMLEKSAEFKASGSEIYQVPG